MRRTVSDDAGAHLLLTEARRRLEAGRADGSHRAALRDAAEGHTPAMADGAPIVGLEALVQRVWRALFRPRRICVE
jgi:hypothetical protein